MAWSELERPLVPPVAFRAPLDPRYDLLRAQVFEKRSLVRWEMASQCPCSAIAEVADTDTDTGEPDPLCPACKGRGLFHHTPRQVPMMVTSATAKPEWFAHYGSQMRGMARFTALPEHLPGPLDRLTILDSTIRMPARKRRQAGATSALDYPVVKRTFDVAEDNNWTYGQYGQKRKAGEVTLGVLYCCRAGLDGRFVPGELLEGVDFDVTAEGLVDWTKGDVLGTAPVVGARFVMEFTTYPVFLVQTIPHTFRDRYVVPPQGPEERRAQSNLHVDAYLEFWGPPGG